MSSVYSVRISKKLKDDIDKIDNVNWQEETRSFLERRVRKERLARDLKMAREQRAKSKKTISSASLIREDRELAH